MSCLASVTLLLLILPVACSGSGSTDLAVCRALIDRGGAVEALPLIQSALPAAAASGDRPRTAWLLIELGRIRAIRGETVMVLTATRKAICVARDADDPELLRAVAVEAERLARRVGETERAMIYLSVAREAARQVRWQSPQAEQLAAGDVPRSYPDPGPRGSGWPGQGFVDTAPFDPVMDRTRDAARVNPLERHSQRGKIAEFKGRLRKDPEFVPDMARIKAWPDPYHRVEPAVLAFPELPPPEIWTLADDFKRVGEAWQVYKFVLKLGKTLDDPFALASIWVNYSGLKEVRLPIKDTLYYATKAGAIAEAIRRIIAFSPYWGTLELAILALDKAVIDVARKSAKRPPEPSFDPGP